MKKESNKKIFINIFLFAVIIFLVIFVIRDSLSEIFVELLATPGPILAGVTLIGVVSLLVEGYTIKNIVCEYNPDFTVMDGFFASAYATFYRVVTFGTGSIVSEVVFYHRKGLKYSQGTGVVALRMVIYKLALTAWALFFLFQAKDRLNQMINGGFWLVIAGVAITAVVIVLLLTLSISLNAQVVLIVIANRLFKNQRLRNLVDKLNMQIYSLRDTIASFIANRQVVGKVFCASMVKLACWYSLPYFILSNQKNDLDFLLSVALISFTVILGGVLPAPGGIGGFEFVYVLLFSKVIGRVDAVSSLLLYRYATYLMPFLIGMVYVLVNKQKEINLEIKQVKIKKEADND